MATTQDAAGRIDLTLNGESITVGQRTLHPVAHLRGWRGHGGDGEKRGGAAFVRLRLVAVHVTEAGKPDYTVSIGDPTAQPLRMLGGIALAIALFFGVLSLLVQWRSAR